MVPSNFKHFRIADSVPVLVMLIQVSFDRTSFAYLHQIFVEIFFSKFSNSS